MKILVEGQLLEYDDKGKGRVVILLHGWGMSLATFDGLAEHLSAKFRVIRLDFPGFGASPRPSDDWGVEEYSKLLSLFIDKLKLGNIYAIAGHSFGGRVIIKGIAHELLSPDKVILIGAAGIKPSRTFKQVALKAVAKTGKALTSLPGINKVQPILRRKLYDAARSTDYLDAKDMQKIFLNVINEDLLSYISAVLQPTLLVWGEDDTETPIQDAHIMLENLPNAKLITVKNAGHFVYLDNPEIVTKEMDEFLA